MNRFIILVLVGLAITVGYLVGTEQGRARRDQLREQLNRRLGARGGPDIDLSEEEGADEALEAQMA